MATVVEAACPGCKRVLRIPAEWMHQAVRCKHCGIVVCARPTAVPASPLPASPHVAAVRAAVPTPPSPSGTASTIFANLDDQGDAMVRPHWRRRRWRGPIVWGVFLAAAVVLCIVFWPQIRNLTNQATTEIAALDEQEKSAKNPPPTDRTERKAEEPKPSEPPKTEPVKKDPPKKEPAKKEQPKKQPAGKDAPRTDPPKKTDKPKHDPPTEPPARSTKDFPRRALTISVNNYLFLNPINYGSPLPKSNSVRTLLERFTSGLRVPMGQSFELSDAAAMGRARPPVKAAIEKALTDFLATSRPQDRIIVLLIAHTVEVDGEVYVIPLEGDQESKDGLIPLTWILGKLGAASARQKILILDTCRFNPTRGQERPGGGPMSEKLDAMLKDPPPGLQVWTACVAGQQSYEFDSSANGNVNNGLFLDCLQRALMNEGSVQRPDEPIRLDPLVAKVNGLMKSELDPLKLVQTSRLTGKEVDSGAPYDPNQPPAAKIAIEVPRPSAEGVAPLADVRAILKDIDVPPIKLTNDGMLMRAESMPPFSAKALAEYKDDGAKTPFREAVEKARATLNQQLKGKRLQEEWQMIGDENKHKAFVKDFQEKELARTLRELEEELADLGKAGKEGRKEEKSKRWQANYDYILARLEAQIAYLYEYNSALGEMRKELPERGPNGWRLASQSKQTGDAAGRKLGTESRKLLDKLAKDNPGTPWEIVAKRDRLTNLGLKWQPNK
jgi:hypothetical protein